MNLGQKLSVPRPLSSTATTALSLILVLLQSPDYDGVVVGLNDDVVDLPHGVEVGESGLVVDVVPRGHVHQLPGKGVRRLHHHAHEVELGLLQHAHSPAIKQDNR